jgi:hypothetical protein
MAQLLALERIVALMSGQSGADPRAAFVQFIRSVKTNADFTVDGVQITCDKTADREIEFQFRAGGQNQEVTWTITNRLDGTYCIDTLSDLTQEFIICSTPAHAYLAMNNFFAHDVAQILKRGPLFWPTWVQAFSREFETAAGKGPWQISNTYDVLYTVVIKYIGTDYAFYVLPAWKVDGNNRQYKYKVAYQYDPSDSKPFGYANNADDVIRWIEERFVPLRAAHTGSFPDFPS